ncbi:MAG: hypothetical protein WAN65_28475 [Candidatus Sulfotelmatobacter sp.]
MKSLRNARETWHCEPLWTCGRSGLRSSAILVVSLLALVLFIERSEAQSPDADTAQNKIHGTVINAVTHDPIGRALVYSGDNHFATLTDSEGRFEFTQPENSGARYPWMARKPGFLEELNRRNEVEVSQSGALTISLVPEALIQGRVTLSTGDAAIGINVQVFTRQVQDGIAHWRPGAMDRTNSNGEFRFAELRPSEYKLLTHEFMDNDPAVTAPGDPPTGFPPVYYPSSADFVEASTIPLAAGQTFHADIALVGQPYHQVRIPIANAEGRGGMSITISPQGHRGPGYSLSYNPEKQRIEGSLPNGKYLVEARSYAPTSSIGQVNISVAGAQVEGPSMALTATSSIVVNVKEEFTSTNWNGSGMISSGGRTFPMPKQRLDLDVSVESAEEDFTQQQGGGSLRPPTGPNDNSMVLEDITPGRYWLRVRAGRGYVASATMGGIDLLRQPFVVGLGATVPIEITMRDDNAEIEGSVAGITPAATPESLGNGRWRPSAHIYCVPLPDSPGQFLELSASSDGTFDYQMVAPGTYHVMAFKNRQPELPYRDPEAMKAYDSKGQVVRVSAGEKASVQLQIINSE